MEVITRFAPSPTGYFHIGGARTALFNYLYAKKCRGKFVLRIEDTDAGRNTTDSVDAILQGMKWLGLKNDGDILFQSSRQSDHLRIANQLISEGKAYKDFTTSEEINVKKVAHANWRFNDRCCVISENEQNKREVSNHPFVVRMRIPRNQPFISFHDEVFGDVQVSTDELDDFVIVRSDGSPLFLLSCVCDDIFQGVTHIIRGQDHLSNTPKQVVIYHALNQPIPIYAHMALITTLKGEKLSKRKHGEIVDLGHYRNNGVLPEAMVNYMATLGYSIDSDLLWDMDALIEQMDLSKLGKSSAKFDFGDGSFDPKLNHLNMRWLREMPITDLITHIQPLLEANHLWNASFNQIGRTWIEDVLTLIRSRFWNLNDFVNQGRAYLTSNVEVDFDASARAKNIEKHKNVLVAVCDELCSVLAVVGPWDHDGIESAVRSFCEAKEIKTGVIINALRTAITGQSVGASTFEIMAILPQELVVSRVKCLLKGE